MNSTMGAGPLTIGGILRHGLTAHGDAEVVTKTEHGVRRASFAEVGERAARLAAALRGLGIRGDERVATFSWNNQEHLEAYLAVPAMGAVLHTLNIRLFPEQVVYIANHAEDRVVIVDSSLLPILAPVLPAMTTVTHVLVVGDGDRGLLAGAGKEVLGYDEVLAAASPGFDWPDVEETSASAMCYTSGTTGNPKGVVFSHRSAYLHAMAGCMANTLDISWRDRILPVVPMFHVNAWGLPFSAFLAGADLVMPDRFLQAEPLVQLIESERPTIAAGVPTIWSDVLRRARSAPVDLSSLRLVICGGAAVPRTLITGFAEQGVFLCQAWGMTEISPIGSVARPPRAVSADQEMDYRSTAGRIIVGVQARVVGPDNTVLPNDGTSVGEVEVRGPWVTASYYRGDDASRFHDGWLRTGDVGSIDPLGYLTLSDRVKDVIKSGGEWISSVDLENELMAHGDVVEAAVVGVPDERWSERPLAAVVVREGATVQPAELRDFLAAKVARWQLPERWTFVDAVPKTSVGKFDKKVLRKQYADGELAVATLESLEPESSQP